MELFESICPEWACYWVGDGMIIFIFLTLAETRMLVKGRTVSFRSLPAKYCYLCSGKEGASLGFLLDRKDCWITWHGMAWR